MSKPSLSRTARDHARYLLILAGDLKAAGSDQTATDVLQASAIISALLYRLDTINEAHGKIGRVLLGREDAR